MGGQIRPEYALQRAAGQIEAGDNSAAALVLKEIVEKLD